MIIFFTALAALLSLFLFSAITPLHHQERIGLTQRLADINSFFVLISPVGVPVSYVVYLISISISPDKPEAEDDIGSTEYLLFSGKIIIFVMVFIPLLLMVAYPVHDQKYMSTYDAPYARWDFEQNPDNQTIEVIHMGGETVDSCSNKDYACVVVHLGDSKTEKQFSGEISGGDSLKIHYDEDDIGKLVSVELYYPSPPGNHGLGDYRVRNESELSGE